MAGKTKKGSSKKKKALTLVKLPRAQQERVDKGIIKAAERWRVNLEGRTSFHFNLTSRALLGNKNYQKKSTEKYIKEHGKALWLWMARIGDYDSMLILLTPLLKNVPSMKLETVTSYTCATRRCQMVLFVQRRLTASPLLTSTPTKKSCVPESGLATQVSKSLHQQ